MIYPTLYQSQRNDNTSNYYHVFRLKAATELQLIVPVKNIAIFYTIIAFFPSFVTLISVLIIH